MSLQELGRENLLLLEEGHCLRDQALEVCGREGRESEEVRATSLETLRQMVGMGIGVTLIPRLAAPANLRATQDGVAVKPLAPPGAGRTIAMVWRRRSPYVETLDRLARTLAGHLPEGVKRPAWPDAPQGIEG